MLIYLIWEEVMIKNKQYKLKSGLFGFVLILFLIVGSSNSHAFSLDFTVTHGVVCPIDQACTFGFYDPVGQFQADIHANGNMVFADPITFSFNNGTQSFSMDVDGGFLDPISSNGPVQDGVIPEGNWDGVLSYTTSDGGTGDFILDGENSGYNLFIDNLDKSFTLSVGDPYGSNSPGNNGIGASFIIVGTIALEATGSQSTGAIPEPSSTVLLALGMMGLVYSRRKKLTIQ